MEESLKRKNILDLQFQKNLTISSTSVIVAFTYLIGVALAYFNGQLRLDDFILMGILFIISSAVLGGCSILFFNSIRHIKNIPEAVKEL